MPSTTVSQEFSPSDARSLIIKPRTTNILSTGTNSQRDWAGEAAFERYKHQRLSEQKYEELIELRKTESAFDHDVSFAIFDRYFPREKTALCSAVRNDFVEFLDNKMNDYLDPSSFPDESLQRYIRENMLQEGFVILCRKGSKEDLGLIREKLDSSELKYDETILSYLERFGDFSDVERIIRISRNPKNLGFSLLIIGRRVSYDRVAKAVLKLATKRTVDLLMLEMSSDLWNAVIRRLSKIKFSLFENDRLCSWLSDEVESKRKTVALKIVICFPKNRIAQILKLYGRDQGRYFYNVVLWLDMGVSLDRNSSISAAKNLLQAL